MRQFKISDKLRNQEIDRLKSRKLQRNRLFVLLIGPSAIGKSTIISEMNKLSRPGLFEYVKPVTTRPNRPGETDKIHVSDQEFDLMEKAGKFVAVNKVYGFRYGAPLEGILSPLQRDNIPILDYILETVSALQRPEYDTLKFYIYPKSIEEWQDRINNIGRNVTDRLQIGTKELSSLAENGLVHPDIDVSIINAKGQPDQAALDIIETIDLVTK